MLTRDSIAHLKKRPHIDALRWRYRQFLKRQRTGD
jgi:hypothetical protein